MADSNTKGNEVAPPTTVAPEIVSKTAAELLAEKNKEKAKILKESTASRDKLSEDLSKDLFKSIADFLKSLGELLGFNFDDDILDEEKPAEPRSLWGKIEKKITGGGSSRVLNHQPDSAALDILKNLKPNENLVSFVTDHGHQNQQLRETTKACYDYARTLAKNDGYDIDATSTYRSAETQGPLWEAALVKYKTAEKARLHVAPPGHSNHQTGGGGDFHLIDTKTGKQLNDPAGYARLENYMNRAGFVRYAPEPWHFEIGTAGHTALVMAKLGKTGTDALYSRLA